jgi:hypothetical protein
VKRKRIPPKEKAVLLAAFAAEPRPSAAARDSLAAQTGLTAAMVGNWFDSERKRVKAAAPAPDQAAGEGGAAADGSVESPDACTPGGAVTPAAAMRKRKAGAYEAPTGDASREALSAALAAEAEALAAALDEPRADLFALLPRGSAAGHLSRAVRGPLRGGAACCCVCVRAARRGAPATLLARGSAPRATAQGHSLLSAARAKTRTTLVAHSSLLSHARARHAPPRAGRCAGGGRAPAARRAS